MSSCKRMICLVCVFALMAGMLMPSLFTAVAVMESEDIILSDGSEWKVRYDSEHNQLSTDGEGRYSMVTDAPDSQDSGFWLVSKNVYPLSTNFQLRCCEAAGAMTEFGLTSSYSLDMAPENSLYFVRKNGSPSENAVKLYVIIDEESYCIATTSASYTRNRVSTISTVKQNGSWYMKWNDVVLDAAGCAENVREYVKLENHFPAEALEAGLPLHFYASCEKVLYEDSFSFKADRVISGGVMSVAADVYADPNNPASVTETVSPEGTFNPEKGSYRVELSAEGTSAAVMSPVTTIDPEKGESGVFYMESYLENYNSASQIWVEYSVSNDPTFSDGTEISFCAVKLANNGGVHLGYFNSSAAWIASAGMNNNYYNDPDSSQRLWQFKTDSETGKIYLYLWGGNLIASESPFCMPQDFSAFAGKPVYVRINTRSTGTAKVTVDVTPDNAEEVSGLIDAAEQTALTVPNNLEEAEDIIAEYDASPYRYTVSEEAFSKILETRMYMYEERENNLNAALGELRSAIDGLPAPEELEAVYNEDMKTAICDTYLDYIALGSNMDRLEQEYVSKITSLLNKLTELDSEFAEKKTQAENFGTAVEAIKELGNITVENYIEVSEKVKELRASYDSMDDFLKSLVDSAALSELELLESRLPAVKAAYETVAMINALPAAADIALDHENSILSARRAYNLLEDKTLVSSEILKHLEDCEKQLENVKLAELDWYSPYSEVKYTGNNTDSYTFPDTSDKVSGDVFATTTDLYDMTENQLYWIGMGCGGSQFMLFGLTSSVKGQELSNSATDNISFILRPLGDGSLNVTFFDAPGEGQQVANIPGFSLASLHKFSFEKAEDGHWYLVIDGNICNQNYYERFDNYMNTYASSTYVSIGGRNGFSANNILIADKNAEQFTGDWEFSLPFGCSYTGDKTDTTLVVKSGAQAVYKPVFESLDNWTFQINTGLQYVEGSDTMIGFLTDPAADGNQSCDPANGVVVRLINRPAAGDNRTHILLLLNGQWITMTAKEPAIMDADYYTVSVEKNTDNHYYIRIRWSGGTVLVKFDRESEYYRLVQLDDIVENGGYFTFISNNHDVGVRLSMTYSEVTEDDAAEEDNKAIVSFILDFEKNFEALNDRKVEAFEYMYSEWQKLNFLTRNSVIADLMDDEAAYGLLLEVMEYKEGNLDEYYTVTEEKLVTKSELDSLIAEYEQDSSADYVISFSADGTVIASIKNLSSKGGIPLLPAQDGTQKDGVALYIITAAVLCSGFAVCAVKRRRGSF